MNRGVESAGSGTGFALANGGNYSEHAQIYDVLHKKGVTGLAVVAGDKHSFWAGLTSADLPPRVYDPVGVEFVTGSISAQGLVEIGDRIVSLTTRCARCTTPASIEKSPRSTTRWCTACALRWRCPGRAPPTARKLTPPSRR